MLELITAVWVPEMEPPARPEDRDASPISRPPPEYPMEASGSWAEAICDISFDVTYDGRTDNIDVACAVEFEENVPERSEENAVQHDAATAWLEQSFERSAYGAVEKWLYDPKIQYGIRIRRRGVVTSFHFQLEN